MKKIKLGKTEAAISLIGLGTWAMGGGPAWGGDKELDACINTIRSCPGIGVNLIDTAPAYNFGNSERIICQALSDMDREELVVVTKCGIVWTREGSLFNKLGDTQLYKNLSRESIMDEIQQSLERLGLDYVDIYMTHWQSVEPFFTPISETMEALNELKSKGLIKGIGVSNATPVQIKEYLNYGDLDIVQGKYSILDRAAEEELLPLCRFHDIVFQAYSPLEQGLLSGSFGRDYIPADGTARKNKKWFQPSHLPSVIDMLDSWHDLCQKYNCTLSNLAIAWLLAQDGPITVLSGATSSSHLEENVKAASITLSKEEAAWMRQTAQTLD
ncbi:oxidoreductase [Bacteroidia bacterium]|nr:oxidoreductase [Bacteroidia bacterium]